MKRRKLLVLLIGVLLIAALVALPFMSACGPSGPGEQEEEEEEEGEVKTVLIGLVAEFTGAYAPIGIPHRNSIRNGVKIFNEEGGFIVDGQRYIIELVEYDSRNDPKRAVAGMTMVKDIHNVKMVHGSFSSQCTLSTQPICEERHIIQINAGASPLVTRPGLEWSWSLAQSTDHRALATVPCLADVLQAKTVAIITENEAFCKSGRESFIAEFEKAGMAVVSDDIYESTVKDFSTIIARAKKEDPDVLFINGVSGWNVQISGQIDLPTDDLFRVTGKAADGLIAMSGFTYWDYKAGKVSQETVDLMGTDMKLFMKVAESFRSQYGDEHMRSSNYGYSEVSDFVTCMIRAGTVDDEMKLRDVFDGMEWQDSRAMNKNLPCHRWMTYIPISVFYESDVGADKSDYLALSYHTDDMQENWISEIIMDYKTITELREERGY